MTSFAQVMDNPLMIWVSTLKSCASLTTQVSTLKSCGSLTTQVSTLKSCGSLTTQVSTLKSCGSLTTQEVHDCVFFNAVLQEICDQRGLDGDVVTAPVDNNARLHNWALLLKRIKLFYKDIMQHVVSPSPNVARLVDSINKGGHLEDLDSVLVLLLGCAVQCDRKAEYITRITSLDIHVQQELADKIRQVTDTTDYVVSDDLICGESDVTKHIFSILQRVLSEKDEIFQEHVDLLQEHNSVASTVDKAGVEASERQHLSRELTEVRVQLHSTLDDLEDKSKALLEAKEEIDELNKEMMNIKTENINLSKDAKAVRAYRDELDNYKEQSLKLEKYEKELSRMKEQLHEVDYLKTRVEELKDDNHNLTEAKETFEAQSRELQKKCEAIMHDLVQIQKNYDGLKEESAQQQRKIEELIEESATLQFENARTTEGYSGPLRRMISYTSSEFLHGSNLQLSNSNPIANELSDSMTSHVARLETENNRLKSELEEIKAKLHDTQSELENIIQQSEKDYLRRKAEFEKQQVMTRKIITDEVTCKLQRDFDTKYDKLKSRSKEEKEQIIEDYEAKVKYLKHENETLKDRIDLLEGETTQLLDKLNSGSFVTSSPLQESGKISKQLNENDKLQANNVSPPVRVVDFQPDVSPLPPRPARIHENGLQVKIHHLQNQKEHLKDDMLLLKQRLESQENKINDVEMANTRLNSENDELKRSLTCERDLAENHIETLERELDTLKTRAAAMENLSEYLHNLSTTDEQAFSLSELPEQLLNHNMSHDSIKSLPSNLHAQLSRSQRGYRGEKIHYVKATSTELPSDCISSRKMDAGKQSSIFSKLKSYVKSQKDMEQDAILKSREAVKLKEVQMRERPAFDRNNKMRHTIQNISLRERPPNFDNTKLQSPIIRSTCCPVEPTFSRNHPLCQTLPERKTTYHFPNSRQQWNPPNRQGSDRTDNCNLNRSSTDDPTYCEISSTCDESKENCFPPNPYHVRCQSQCCSGSMSSRGNVLSEQSLNGKHTDGHRISGFEVFSTDMVRGKPGDSYDVLYYKEISKLQQQNKKLSDENNELSKALNLECFNNSSEKTLLQKLMKLESENRKLKTIIETLQFSLSGNNPYDKNRYQYFTNV